MRIYILCENQAKMGSMDKVFLAEHGLSIFIDASAKILFDFGATDVFLRNAKLLDIDLGQTDLVVISHGHWDHTNGLRHFPSCTKHIRLAAHPDIFTYRFNKSKRYIGVPGDFEVLTAGFHKAFTREPVRIARNICFLGEIPRVNDFESLQSNFFRIENHQEFPDHVIDDSALALDTSNGLVVVSGCSHAGICNIVEHAKNVMQTTEVHMVIGGFHLLDDPDQLQGTVRYFQENRVDLLCPMHCTDLPALCSLARYFPLKKLCAGDWLDIP